MEVYYPSVTYKKNIFHLPFLRDNYHLYTENSIWPKQNYSFETSIVKQKMSIINSVDDGIKKASNGAIQSATSLLNKTKHYVFEVYRTFDGQVQINYYYSQKKPLEVYVSYHRFDVLFPDDNEMTFKTIKDICRVVSQYYRP